MSLTLTRDVRSRRTVGAVKPQRPYDHHYDPVFTVSSEVDHRRAALKAQASENRARRVPEFKSMFSSLPHHPCYTLHMDSADPVPATIGQPWRGPAQQNMAALQQLAGVIPNSRFCLTTEECRIRGSDRWKFYKRPQIPFEQQTTLGGVFFPLSRDDAVSTGSNSDDQPAHVTVGVQTDYRESEAQTDPYSPDYVIRRGTTPSELLQLATLTWGHGLPAGMKEIEMIQRARAIQAWKATLPPLDDLSQVDKRRKMMEEMELEEWAFREAEIQKLHEARHAVSVDLLKERVKSQKKATNQTLNQLYSKLENEKETRKQKIHSDYMRSLRKLETKRQQVKRKIALLGTEHFVANETCIHTDFSTNKSAYNNYLKDHYLQDYDGLQKLELGLFKPQVRRSKPKVTSRDIIHSSVSTKLKKYKALKKEIEHVEEKPLRYLVKKEKPLPRPVTPTVDEPPEGEEEKEHAVIFIQKILRGRRAQYEMLKGTENHMELIQELRTVNGLQKEEQELKDADKELVLSLKEERDKARHKASQEEAAQAGAIGAELHHLFDTMSKELVRLQEERRIHAFALLAERDRRLREAEESGRRQAEERRRIEEDEIFRQVVQVHQETVDLYLEDIILETLERTVDQQAREDIHRRAQEVNDIALTMEEGRNRLQSEEIVSELVYSFLIPEIDKMSVRRRVHQRQQRHLQAARSIIQEALEHAGNHPRTSSGMSCPSDAAIRDVGKGQE